MTKRERALGKPAEEENEKQAEEAPRESGVRERREGPEAIAAESRETLESARQDLSEKAASESADFSRETMYDVADLGKEYGAAIAPEETSAAASLAERATEAGTHFERSAAESVKETGADRFRADVERVKGLEKDVAAQEAKLAELNAMREFMNYPGGQRGVDSEKEWLASKVAELRKGIDAVGEGYGAKADSFRADVESVKKMEKDAAAAEAKLRELSAMKEFMNYPGGQRGVDSEKEWLTSKVAELRKGIDAVGEGYAELPIIEGLETSEAANDNAIPFDGDRPAMLPPSPEVARASRELSSIENLLSGLPPEAAAKAIDRYKNAPEDLYGGIGSKGMTPEGTVRLSYRDGTILELSADGRKRSNRPETTGGEPFPDFKETAESAAEPEASLLTLEDEIAQDDDELSRLRGGVPSPEALQRIQDLTTRVNKTKHAIVRKSTPEGLKKEMDSLRTHIAEAEADLNLAPEEERSVYADLIDKWSNDMQTLQERLRTSSPESGPDTLPDMPDDAERMTLDDDPRMQGIVEEKSLDLLLDGYRGFAEKYAMNLGPDGTVLTKDGKNTGKEPSEFLTEGDRDVVRQQAKEIFGHRYPADKEQYDRESDADLKKAA